ncbi:MAG: hypothetical protein EOO71_29730 [Myxococcaceae bacterium]|nr:MAG: hypothetical protein EOO71_29730 [Myxococcaceae bacterium]
MKSLLVGMMLASTLNAAPSRVVSLSGTVHSADIGNQQSVGAVWLPSEPRRIEQFEFHLPRPIKGLHIEYRCHLQDTGDTQWLSAGTPCGTQGEARRLESFAMRLSGPAARLYQLRYWCQVDGASRPSGPYSDEAVCGTQGESRELIGMKVELVRM